MKRMLFAFILLMQIVSQACFSQTAKGTLAGRVTDSSGAVLHGARVILTPSDATILTDKQGEFLISGLIPGSYSVKVSYLGFTTLIQTTAVLAGQTARFDAVLQVAGATQQVVVTDTEIRGDVEEINRTLTSPNILNVLTNEQIMALPNFTIADAIGRLPGVTLERDEGDGKYVQVRGTEPRLTNTTIDGINVPSPESGVRQVKLDVVPADLVESVEVNKTLSANQDGDAIGGSVNLVTRTAGESPTINGFGQFGYTPIIQGRHASQYGITAGKRLMGSKRLGVLGNFTYDYNGRGIDDVEPANDTGVLTPTYDSMVVQEYQYDRTRWGAAESVDYKLSEGSSLYARGLYSDFKDYGDKWTYQFNDSVTANPNAPSTGEPAQITGVAPQFTNSKRLPDYAIATLALGGKHQFTNSWLSWETSAARARQSAAGGNPGTTFTYTPTTDAANNVINSCVYNASANPSKYRPQWDPACSGPSSPVYDPTQYTLSELDLTRGQTTQLNLQAQASYAFNYHAVGHASTFEFGFKIRNGHKGQFAYSPALIGTGPLMSEFLNDLTNSRFYGGSYHMGPLIDYDRVVAYNNANPGILVEDPYQTALNGDASNFNYDERITAGYIMNTIEFNKFHLQTGLRFEATNLKTTGYQVTTVNPTPTDPSGYGGTIPVNGTGSYLDVLPSVQLRYNMTNDIGIRAVFSRGMSRPDPQASTYKTQQEITFPRLQSWMVLLLRKRNRMAIRTKQSGPAEFLQVC